LLWSGAGGTDRGWENEERAWDPFVAKLGLGGKIQCLTFKEGKEVLKGGVRGKTVP